MKIGIIGAGKVGISIGCVLKAKGIDVVAVSDRDETALRLARSYLGDACIYTVDNEEVVTQSDTIAVTTHDREIRVVAREMFWAPVSVEKKLFFHTSGAHHSHELSPLDEKGAVLGSLHPLQTFPDIASAISVLPNTYIFIEGDAAAIDRLKFLGDLLGHKVLTIDGKNKVLYHLSAVFVCNLLCALFYSGEGVMKRIGIDLVPFYPIINATLKNIEEKGPLMSLTGPIIRGDVGTVLSHIDEMEGMDTQKEVYRALSETILEMVEKRRSLSEPVIDELRRALGTIRKKDND